MTYVTPKAVFLYMLYVNLEGKPGLKYIDASYFICGWGKTGISPFSLEMSSFYLPLSQPLAAVAYRGF